MIRAEHPKLGGPAVRVAELPRAPTTAQPKPESDENLELMRWIDDAFGASAPHVAAADARTTRCRATVNRKRVQRLMRLLERRRHLSQTQHLRPASRAPRLSLFAEGPGRRSSQSGLGHGHGRVDPRWLCTLCAVIDWHTRRVAAGSCPPLDATFCVQVSCAGRWPSSARRIFNTDQGCQFTAEFTQPLLAAMNSRWTAKAAAWTTCSSSACGDPSNTRRFTSSRATPPHRGPRCPRGLLRVLQRATPALPTWAPASGPRLP